MFARCSIKQLSGFLERPKAGATSRPTTRTPHPLAVYQAGSVFDRQPLSADADRNVLHDGEPATVETAHALTPGKRDGRHAGPLPAKRPQVGNRASGSFV